MAEKKGDYRIRKGTAVFGPMSRSELDVLLHAKRIGPSDSVSVRGGDWTTISAFLGNEPTAGVDEEAAGAQFVASPGTTDAEPGWTGEGKLRVCRDGKIFRPITRAELKQLLEQGRVDTNDLICAVGGPWMILGDFLAPTPRPGLMHGGPPPVVCDELEEVHAPPPAPPPSAPTAPTAPPLAAAPPRAAPQPAPAPVPAPLSHPQNPYPGAPGWPPGAHPAAHPAAPPMYYPPAYPQHVPPMAAHAASATESGAQLPDSWFVKVRGLTSTNVRKEHLKSLLAAREITMDSSVSHHSWGWDRWSKIRDVPQLADLDSRK